MKTINCRTNIIVYILIILAIILLNSCTKFSEIIRDKSAGMNGSFEITESGLPVNWLVYTPKTIPTGDYDLVIDTTECKDGRQSLKFLVRECSPIGGWASPGLCQEYEAIPGETYRISLWVKNDGCEFVVRIGGVSVKEGQYDTIVKSKETIDIWKHFEYNYKMPLKEKFDRIRFEMNILYPGNFWIDDIKIEGINGISVIPTAR